AAGADDASARPQTLAIARNATNLETTHFKGFQKDFKGLQKDFKRISKDFKIFPKISAAVRTRATRPAPASRPGGRAL
ncbi:MAG: hypothetical protein ABR970_20620, partial [Roseiarcus sp.]